MNPPQLCTAKLAEKIHLNDKYIQYTFELTQPHRIEFQAGQYVSVQVSPEGHRRPYSIASAPSNTHGFELLVDMTPNGVGVKYLDSLKFGEEIKGLVPMGQFVIGEEANTTPIVFVATGSGIAPFRSMILDQLHEKKNTRPMILYWGLRHVENLFWEDEFQELATNFPNFRFHPVLSQAGSEWPLCHGRVTDCLAGHELLPDAHYYLCGNTHMVEDVLKFLPTRGVKPENLHHEKFY